MFGIDIYFDILIMIIIILVCGIFAFEIYIKDM